MTQPDPASASRTKNVEQQRTDSTSAVSPLSGNGLDARQKNAKQHACVCLWIYPTGSN